jgi:hypothetical protein
MTVVERDADRLRRDDASESRFLREFMVPMNGVRIVQRHHPAADIAGRTGLPELTAADAMIDVAEIERDFRTFCCG